MREQFEQRDADGLARIGELAIPRAGVTVETPTFLPVVNPNRITIDPARFRDFGVQMLITNSYIIQTSGEIRDRAVSEGLHEMLGFDGAIMTDSGSFQLATYGNIDVTTTDILEFQHRIGSDIGTPVDIPTPPDADRDQIKMDLQTTAEALADAGRVDVGNMLVNAPVQGSTDLELREQAGKRAAATDLDVFPVGAVVPLLNEYRYKAMIDVILAAKRGLNADCPVHLFGAGHPMMLALATAAGCDLFDSAAYALYARDERYLTVSGTEHLADLEYLPCSCPVCASTDPAELRNGTAKRVEQSLAEHNLHVTFEEIRRIKNAIKQGTLFDLVERRARGHPAMVDGYHALLDHSSQLEVADPVSKSTFFHLSPASSRRPEIVRYHERVSRLETPDSLLLTQASPPSEHDYDAVWELQPPFGPYPQTLSETYPLTAEVPDRLSTNAQTAAARGVRELVTANPDTSVTVAHIGWAESALAALPEAVSVQNLRPIIE